LSYILPINEHIPIEVSSKVVFCASVGDEKEFYFVPNLKGFSTLYSTRIH